MAHTTATTLHVPRCMTVSSLVPMSVSCAEQGPAGRPYTSHPRGSPHVVRRCCRLCLSLRHRQQKKRRHTTPLLPWAMADCACSRQRKAVYQYQRPSVVNKLRRAESDMTARALAYSLSVDIVNIFLCHLSHFC